MNHTPTLLNERIHEIDAIRGASIFGILFMNIMSFAGEFMDILSTFHLPAMYSGKTNQFVLFLVNVFVTTNFYTLFSILFGLGFFIFLTRAKDKTSHPNRLFLRRLMGLLIIGIIHAIFIWYGDILVTYAIVGMLLIPFMRVPPKWNLIIATIISIIMTALMYLLYLLTKYVMGITDIGDVANPNGLKSVVMSRSYLNIIEYNFDFFKTMLLNTILVFPMILMMFLIGLYIGQKGYHKNIGNIRPLLIKVAVVSFIISFPIKVFTGYIQSYRYDDMALVVLSEISGTLGGPLMAIFYLSTFALLFNASRKLTKIFAPVGRMALTNYVAQSVVMIILFYGFNLFDRIEMKFLPIIVILFFIIQAIFSKWYMSKFKFGPLEYLWKKFTYR